MIDLPIPAQAQHQLNQLTGSKPTMLKLGQVIDAKLTQVSKDQKTIQLSIKNQQVAAILKDNSPASVRQAAPLQSGQIVKLVVAKLHPQTELKVLLPEQQTDTSTNKKLPSESAASHIKRDAPTYILKTSLNTSQPPPSTSTTAQAATSRTASTLLIQTPPNTANSAVLSLLKPLQKLNATIIHSDSKKIKLRIFVPTTSQSSTMTTKITNTENNTKQLKPNASTKQNQAPLNSKLSSNAPATNKIEDLKNSPTIKQVQPPSTTKLPSNAPATNKIENLKTTLTTKQAQASSAPVKQDPKNSTENQSLNTTTIKNTLELLKKSTFTKQLDSPSQKTTENPPVRPTININNTPNLKPSDPSPSKQIENLILRAETAIQKKINNLKPNATATQPKPNSVPKSAITIEFPNSKPKTSPPFKLSQNQAITIQVVKPGEHPQFKILPPLSPKETINKVLKEQLPKEQAPTELLKQISRELPQVRSGEKVPETLKRLSQEILNSLPKQQQVTEGAQLKKAINNSGLFLESKLAQAEQKTGQTFNTDFKATLLKFVQALQQEPGTEKTTQTHNEQLNAQQLKDLLNKSEGTLARLVLNQLKSLPQEDSTKQSWLIDLPFVDKKQTHSVKIEIEKQASPKHESEQKSWSVSLTLSPPNLDTLHCKVSYFDNAVHTHFWSEGSKTTELIQNNLDYLAERFEAEGLTTGNMNASQQSPENSQQKNPYTGAANLFNGKA